MTRAPLLVAAGLLAQAVVLAPLAGAGPRGALGLAGGGALAGAVAAAAWPRLASGSRASLAMLAAGGLGMTLGWWADLGFASAADALRAAPGLGAWCGLAPRDGGAAPISWMDAGMLAAGVGAIRGAHTAAGGGTRELAIEALAMLAGMHTGAALAARFAAPASAEGAVVAAHAAMNAGMVAGMLAAGAWLARASANGRRDRG